MHQIRSFFDYRCVQYFSSWFQQSIANIRIDAGTKVSLQIGLSLGLLILSLLILFPGVFAR